MKDLINLNLKSNFLLSSQIRPWSLSLIGKYQILAGVQCIPCLNSQYIYVCRVSTNSVGGSRHINLLNISSAPS